MRSRDEKIKEGGSNLLVSLSEVSFKIKGYE